MKKSIRHILFGVIIGVSISFSPQIYGASASLLGKDVDKQMEVKLNDKVIGNAAVIEGTSYIPVRAFANEYQLDIAVNTTTITLTSPTAEENAKVAKEQEDATNKPIKIENLNFLINLSKTKINNLTEMITTGEQDVIKNKATYDYVSGNKQTPQVTLDSAKQQYDDSVTSLANNKTALAKEQAALADLESQLAALQQK